ncbi:MAG: hypothetical protein ACYTF1_16795 [Planctomycetota bacterium]|jgi:cytochrome c-type biogenesis protein CcmH/NrfG
MNDPINTRWFRWTLTGIVFLLAVIAIELSTLMGPIVPAAQAQVFDSKLQRQQLLEAQQQTNSTLKQILQHLRTQVVKVEVTGTDKDKKSMPGRPKIKSPVLKK